jgi:hypothetical protein
MIRTILAFLLTLFNQGSDIVANLETSWRSLDFDIMVDDPEGRHEAALYSIEFRLSLRPLAIKPYKSIGEAVPIPLNLSEAFSCWKFIWHTHHRRRRADRQAFATIFDTLQKITTD